MTLFKFSALLTKALNEESFKRNSNRRAKVKKRQLLGNMNKKYNQQEPSTL